MKNVIVMKDVRRISGVILALSAMGLFIAPSAMADSLSGGPFLGANSSSAGGPENSSSFTTAGSQARSMGHSQQHSKTNGIGPSHSYSGSTYTRPGRAGVGYYSNHNWDQNHNNNYSNGAYQRSNASGPANPTPSAAHKPVVQNYMGRNTSHTGQVNYYTWGINKLKSKRTINR